MDFRIRIDDDISLLFSASTAAELSAGIEDRLSGPPRARGRYLDVRAGRHWLSVHAHACGARDYVIVNHRHVPDAWDHAERTLSLYAHRVWEHRERLGMDDPEDLMRDISKGAV